MTHLSRRRALQLALGAGLAPLLARASATLSETATAQDFANGRMKGFAIGSVRGRASDESYFDALAATGANVARIFFPFRKCPDCTRFDGAPADIAALRRILDWSRARGIRIVVVGDFDGHDNSTFWEDAALRRSFVEKWDWLAAEFRNDPAIAGLDLMNEPNPPRPHGRLDEAQSDWRSLAAEAIARIRSTGVTLPIVYEGVGGGQSVGLRNFVPFEDSQVVYSIHVYTPHAITHQHVYPTWPRTIPYPAGVEWGLKDAVLDVGEWNRQRLQLALKDTIEFQQRTQLPIFVGEFSCVRWAPNGSAYRYVADCLAIFRQFGWSWTYHEFRGWPGWDAEIASEERSVTTRSQNAPVVEMLRSEIAKH